MDNSLRDFADEISSNLLTENKLKPLKRVVLMGNQVLTHTGAYSKNYGIYPESALEMSKRIIITIRGEIKDVFLVTLINDWKLIKGFYHGEKVRRDYWANPNFDYKQVMEETWHPHLLSGKGPGSSQEKNFNYNFTRGRISEQRLHNEYARFRAIDQNGKRIDQTLEENGFQCEIGAKSCNAGKCASELIMTWLHFYQLRIQRVIAFLPSECQGPIETGAQIFKELGGIFIANSKMKTDYRMQIDHIYFNSSAPETPEQLLSPHLPKKVILHQVWPF